MGSVAQIHTFGPYLELDGSVITTPKIYHYEAGTTTLKNAWSDRAKATTVAQPLVGDAYGVASAYFDGLYKIVVKRSDDSTVFTWDNFNVVNGLPYLDVNYTWDPGSINNGSSATSNDITVTGAVFGNIIVVGPPYDLAGVVMQARITAAGFAKIRLQNNSGSAYAPGSGSWKIIVYQP